MVDEVVVPEWAKEGLPETFHAVPFLKDTTSPENFIEKLTHASQHMGNSMRIPGPDATPDLWTEFKDKLSAKVPGLIKADLTTDEGQRELLVQLGLPAEQAEYGAGEDNGWLAEAALKAGLTKNQFTNLVGTLGDVNKDRNLNKAAENQQEVEALYAEWGLAKPKNLDNINGLLELTNAPDGFKKELADGVASANTLKWLAGIAGQFAESSKFKKDVNSPESITPGEAVAQIQELMQNPEFHKQTPLALELRQKMVKLQLAAHPGSRATTEGLVATGPELLEMFENS